MHRQHTHTLTVVEAKSARVRQARLLTNTPLLYGIMAGNTHSQSHTHSLLWRQRQQGWGAASLRKQL